MKGKSTNKTKHAREYRDDCISVTIRRWKLKRREKDGNSDMINMKYLTMIIISGWKPKENIEEERKKN